MAIQIVTINQAAKIFEGSGLTRTAIRRLVITGEIPSRRIGVKYLIALEDLEKWFKAC